MLQPSPVTFILAITHGVFAHFFSDFGDSHSVTDPNGEPKRSLVIEGISPDGVVQVAGESHGLDDGDCVSFDEVKGLDALKALPSVRIKRQYRKQIDPKTKKTRNVQVLNDIQDRSSKLFLSWLLSRRWHCNGGQTSYEDAFPPSQRVACQSRHQPKITISGAS